MRPIQQSPDDAPTPVAAPRGRAPSATRAQMDLSSLEARRGELRNQLQSITERRALLSAQMRDADAGAREQLRGSITNLDDRTARIDNELNSIDDAINALLARGVTRPPSGFDQLIQGMRGTPAPLPPRGDFFSTEMGEIVGGMLALQGLTLVLLLLVLWRTFRRFAAPRLAAEEAGRLEQLQRSVDVMAVEVERISEAQRFVAKKLNAQPMLEGERVRAAEEAR